MSDSFYSIQVYDPATHTLDSIGISAFEAKPEKYGLTNAECQVLAGLLSKKLAEPVSRIEVKDYVPNPKHVTDDEYRYISLFIPFFICCGDKDIMPRVFRTSDITQRTIENNRLCYYVYDCAHAFKSLVFGYNASNERDYIHKITANDEEIDCFNISFAAVMDYVSHELTIFKYDSIPFMVPLYIYFDQKNYSLCDFYLRDDIPEYIGLYRRFAGRFNLKTAVEYGFRHSSDLDVSSIDVRKTEQIFEEFGVNDSFARRVGRKLMKAFRKG